MLELLFRSKAEVKVLGVVLFSNGLHLRGIAKEADLSSSETKRELDILVNAGVLKKEKKGNLLLFNRNERCDFIKDLRSLYLTTTGLYTTLFKQISPLKGIKYSFVFGSMAGNNFREKSDLDLMVIGDVSDDALASAMFEFQQKTKREVNFILWSIKDFNDKLREQSRFLENISGNRKWIMGDENEFKRAIGKAYGRQARA